MNKIKCKLSANTQLKSEPDEQKIFLERKKN